MPSFWVKSGDSITIGDDVAVQVYPENGSQCRVCVQVPEGMPVVREEADPETENRSRSQAKELVSEIPIATLCQDETYLNAFLSELVRALGAEQLRVSRRERQKQGIAAAKAKGVQFGRAPRPLPDNFYAVAQAWRGGTLSLQKAAKACHMSTSSFTAAAKRLEVSQSSEPRCQHDQPQAQSKTAPAYRCQSPSLSYSGTG